MAVAGVLVLGLLLVSAVPTGACEGRAQGDGGIPTYDVVLSIRRDGVVGVRETITFDYGDVGGHGFARRVPYRVGERVYDIRDLRTSSSTGAPARARTVTLPHDLQITVGDGKQVVRGRQAYVIEYDLGRAFTPLSGGRWELVWDAVGTTWNSPIANAAVRVESPVARWKASCRAGHGDATVPCQRDRDGPYAMDFLQSGLGPHEGMTVRVRLPRGAVAPEPPRFVRPYWDGTWTGTGLLALTLVLLPWISRAGGLGRSVLIGRILLVTGVLAVLVDAAADVERYGMWAVSLGDLTVAGLALGIAGSAALCGQCAPCDTREE
ncbi:DUF2207 domain-containing protein [Actinomadura rupiterrae]|uniref:DUF2207 domain-containing protein n=1 Tax=Actinomadura rupiterrae TaxID=559627 RepID=UPI0020A302C3|nr:DUF2207 domain-containing protein [Actinomadura rupiterrae]MCP2335001.1 hypothetical protein [Actinomadura rupiterrae]